VVYLYVIKNMTLVINNLEQTKDLKGRLKELVGDISGGITHKIE